MGRKEGHANIQISAEPGLNWGPCGWKAEILPTAPTTPTLNGFGGRYLSIIDVCMYFEPCFKVYNLVSVYLKSITLGQMTTLYAIFHVVMSIYQLAKI